MTPGATLETLFASFGIEDASEEEVRRLMAERGRFHLNDPAGYRACFADYRGPQDEGLAGYVFGRLAAAKDHLTTTMSGDQARVFPDQGEPGSHRAIVLRRFEGGWKIVLRESVPAATQRQLWGVYHRGQAEARRHGLPVR
jgi:hypothetical protein